jgi:type IV pilus assembly protein PilA
VARSQVTAGLADIRGGVTAFEEIVNKGTPTAYGLNELGLRTPTTRCAVAMTPGAAGTITCTLTGNPKVVGKVVTLTRQSNGAWNCTIPGLDAKYLPAGCV